MADPLRLVAYINGVRFWPSNVSLMCPGDDLPEFSVEVPAAPEWTLLPARSHVAIFFSDPVTKIWRLLVEGEYEGWERQRLATGVRRMALRCRSLHGFWQTTTFANAVGAYAQDQAKQGGAVDLYRRSLMNGMIVEPSQNPGYQVASLNTLLGANNGKAFRLSAFFLELLQRLTLQTPVECFYSQARGAPRKMFCLQDDQITNAISTSVFLDLLNNQLNSAGIDVTSPLKEVYQRYEQIAFYRHVGIISPPIYQSSIIPELMFIPDLYNVVPPVCNVIFRDQIQGSAPSRSLLNEPSRVFGMFQYATGAGTLPPYYMVNNAHEMSKFDQNVPANGVSPGLAITHGAFTEDDFIGGVRLAQVRLPFEKVTAPTNTESARLETYIDIALRHAFAVERGARRTATYTCSFLPYIQPGFPCLIEDGDLPVHGFIERVEHQISPTSQPSTIVTVSHVREAFVIEGRNRTPALPNWLNDSFRPDKIDATYQKLFGPNISNAIVIPPRAAMVNGPVLTIDTVKAPVNTVAAQVNMDALAGLVIPVPKYSEQYRLMGPVTSVSVADRLRMSADPQSSMLAFQYRAGTSLWQYSVMHNLDTSYAFLRRPDAATFQQVTSVDDSSTVDNALIDPPEDLSPTTASDADQDGHPMFGHPLGMQMTASAQSVPLTNQPPGQKSDQYGVYKLIPGGVQTRALVSPMRQQIARQIRDALQNGITSYG